MRDPDDPRTVLAPGPPDARGYRRLAAALPDPLTVRNELGGASSPSRYRSLLTFAHLSDLHITDVQSPARAEFLDRYGDPDSAVAPQLGRVGTYRAQEALTAQVVESMARAIRTVSGGPLTGAALDFAITTGDSTDNCQENELDSYIALLDGGREVVPDSGDRSRYEGVGSSENYDVRYWHPDGTPEGERDDFPRAVHGLPLVPGLLDASTAPFVATGLGVPWYAVYGNHDALFGGTLPPVGTLGERATGSLKVTGLDEGVDVVALLEGNETSPSAGEWGLVNGPAPSVTPDPRRRPVDRPTWIRAHLGDAGVPPGHGYDEEAATTARAYYGFDAGRVRCLVLDSVNGAGGWQGSLDDEQFAWLEGELVAGHSHYLDEDGNRVRGGGADRLFIVFSHHTLETLINDFSPSGAVRHLGDELAALFLRFPNVVCWLNGHTHVHAVRAITDGSNQNRGFWQITTASHIDWPQQARIVELAVDEQTGDLVIGAVTLDHAGRRDPRGEALDEPTVLAGWSRELALNAWQGRKRDAAGRDVGEPIGRGEVEDRNVLLVVPANVRLDQALSPDAFSGTL